MSSCRDCQHQLGDNDRFCSQCGSLQSEEIEVLGAEKATTSSTVARSGPSSATLALGAAGLVLAVLLWAFVGRGDVEGVDEAADENAEQAVADDTATTERPDDNDDEPMATTRMHGTDGDDEDAEGDDEEDEAEEVETGPLLGREVGLTLLVGGRSELVEIDLDSGEIDAYRIGGSNPVARSGNWLVFGRPSDNSLSAVPLDNLNLAPVPLDVRMTWSAAVSRAADPDYLWVLAENDDTDDSAFVPVWKRVRLIDGEVVEEVTTGASAFFGAAGGPELASAPDGGIYERVDGDYRRVADGALVAVADDRVIVQDCSGPSTCAAHWLDRSSWERLDGPDLPEEVQRTFGPGWLSSGGRIFASWGFNGLEIIDLQRDTQIELSDENWELGPGAVSPDERFLVTVRAGHPEVLDLDSGEIYTLEHVSMSGEFRALFVDHNS